jgi:hypothetical protein
VLLPERCEVEPPAAAPDEPLEDEPPGAEDGLL